jgi:Zn finger protein HypA/HybF involved in hydrogenase expression
VDTLGHAVLVAKLRKVIDDFELMSEEEEKEMIVRIAEMTSTYPKELQMAFENIKNGEETVAKKDLIEMFQKL